MIEKDIKQIKIVFTDGREIYAQEGISLLELSKDYETEFKSTIVAAKVDNDIKELNFHLYNDCKVQFIDLTSNDGLRIYRRSLYFILIKAVHELFPDRKVVVSHSIGKGLYCEVKGSKELSEEEVHQIEARMRELVNAKIPFVKRITSLEAAKDYFQKIGRMDRYHAIEHRSKPYVTVYNCGGLDDYFYGYMVPDTGYIQLFDLKFYAPGLILRFPETSKPKELPEFAEQRKLFNIFIEFKKWNKILGVDNVGALNDIIKEGKVCEIIRVAEALHEKKIAQIADMIAFNEHEKKLVTIAGPSSSGKTTFANRLAIQLRVNGLKPVTISLDDYFVDREKTPKDESGDYDFEALGALDVPLFNKHLAELIDGKEVEIPIFNFPNGCRDSVGRKLKMNQGDILVIEGIHGLNEKLTATIPRDKKFKIYVSALTSMSIDDHNRIPTTDTRIIRRIVRDYQFRGCSAINTIKRWPSVRRGEDKNIFPFQEEADIMFNSSLIYELGTLKTLAEPLLAEIDSSQPEYSEAKRLIEFLSYFLPIESKEIPLNSIIREFLGGSCFYS
ncbi:MAG: nucleoside kinase [Clostridia bacterium]|nr:nucleoside kinase [Clostridia bacterium]